MKFLMLRMILIPAAFLGVMIQSGCNGNSNSDKNPDPTISLTCPDGTGMQIASSTTAVSFANMCSAGQQTTNANCAANPSASGCPNSTPPGGGGIYPPAIADPIAAAVSSIGKANSLIASGTVSPATSAATASSAAATAGKYSGTASTSPSAGTYAGLTPSPTRSGGSGGSGGNGSNFGNGSDGGSGSGGNVATDALSSDLNSASNLNAAALAANDPSLGGAAGGTAVASAAGAGVALKHIGDSSEFKNMFSAENEMGSGLAGTAGAGRDPASANGLSPMVSKDPDDYFTRVGIDESIFKTVERRYRNTSSTWVTQEARMTAVSVMNHQPK